MEGAGRRLEGHADVGNAKLRGRGRHAYSARPCRSTASPIAGDYVAKAVPAVIAVCVCPLALIGVPRPSADDGKLLPLYKLSAALSRMPHGIRESLGLHIRRLEDGRP